MRRKPLAAVLALLSAALVLGGNALLDAGWGSALRSIADRVLPNPEIAMWAPAPEPGSHASSYADATGAGANYVYLVDAADDRGNIRELQLIFFGRESDGEGWLEIEARGGSGVRYRACNAAEAPAAARGALDRRARRKYNADGSFRRSNMARILAVDDERAILDALARVLGRDGHEVVKAADPTAVPGMDLSRFDLVLCDVMMPGLDGFELVRQIRPDFDGPIIFLTARVAEEDAVAGYGLGADDYVRKPFGAAELRAKVAAHLRRERRPRSHALSFGEVRIDLGARDLAVGGEAVPLTPTEYAICEYLARHPGQVMSRAQIREAVLGWESDADDAAISMQVSRARRKLSEAGADPIATVWGMGYKWQL